jgi:hypothetical protein
MSMATNPETVAPKKPKAVVLGRSAATGRVVLAPAVTKKGTVSVQRIEAAVKSALSKKK